MQHMNKKVIIIGAGGHAKVIADIVRKNNDIVVGFLDDAYDEKTEFYDSLIYGKISNYKEYADCEFIIAIGNNPIREKISKKMCCEWYTAIHPSAQISDSVKIGKGSCVMANAVINADTTIGSHAIINTGAIIEHDCKVGDFTHISPRATVCGLVSVGRGAWLGAGSVIKNVLNICENAIVGAGGVVISDITEKGIYVGVPARKNDNGRSK